MPNLLRGMAYAIDEASRALQDMSGHGHGRHDHDHGNMSDGGVNPVMGTDGFGVMGDAGTGGAEDTSGGMHHEGMDHGGHMPPGGTGGGMHGMGGMHMYMYASDRPGAFLFKFWDPNTDGWYALSCIVVVLLGVVQALLALARDRIAARILADERRARRRANRARRTQHENPLTRKMSNVEATAAPRSVGGGDDAATTAAGVAAGTATTLKVGGMTCDSCVDTIRTSLLELDGVTGVRGDLARGRIHVTHAAGARHAALLEAVEDVGFDAAVDGGMAATDHAPGSYGSIQRSSADTVQQGQRGQEGGNDGGGNAAAAYPVAKPIGPWHEAPAALKTFVMLANAGSVTLGYFLMLIAMTFNWGLFISVVAGITCGYAILLRDKVKGCHSRTGGVTSTDVMDFDELPSGGDCCA